MGNHNLCSSSNHRISSMAWSESMSSLLVTSRLTSHRIGTFFTTSNHSLPRPRVFNPVKSKGIVACAGPRMTDSIDLDIYAYPSLPRKFPAPAIGGHDILGTDGSVCYTRDSRYKPYGISDQDLEWPDVSWGQLQSDCLAKNEARFQAQTNITEEVRRKRSKETVVTPRQAIILRSHDGHEWKRDHFLYTRALISELSLASGGEFEVILLVQLNSEENQSLSTTALEDDQTIQRLKDQHVPVEFHDLTIFFNDDMLKAQYPIVGEYSYIQQAYMPVQLVALSRPQFDFFWVIEQDFRYTGHNYEFFHRVGEWAKAQPRKHIWERSQNFYVPQVYKTWANYSRTIASRDADPILGPKQPDGYQYEPLVPLPNPIPQDWGVGEEADVITLLTIWNPEGSGWWAENEIHAFPPNTPRRASPPNLGRYSRRALMQTHKEQVEQGSWLECEMTNPTTALLHGLKAVYAPHPQYFDEDIDMNLFDHVWQGGTPGEPLHRYDAHGETHAFNELWFPRWQRLTFSWRNQLSQELYMWWSGEDIQDGKRNYKKWQEAEEGVPCYPPIALHPIKI